MRSLPRLRLRWSIRQHAIKLVSILLTQRQDHIPSSILRLEIVSIPIIRKFSTMS
jgi:hypothetical protein